MEIKKIAKNSFDFVINRLIELLGLCVAALGLLLLISLISYSPEDPNFIFTGEKEIKNILGFKGSVISDFFFPVNWTNFNSGCSHNFHNRHKCN